LTLAEEHLETLVEGLRQIFGDDLIGAYLHGWAALGCFGLRSDVDVVVSIRRPTSADEKRRLSELCLTVSQPRWDPGPPLLLELDVVVGPALRPWRHPSPLDFHYSESLREAFERGEPKPWRVDESGDLAASLTILHAAGIVLAGESIADAFPPVPIGDYRAAILGDLEWCLEHLEGRKLYVVLTLARVWAGLSTEEIHSKASAAEWALPQLPPELRPVLAHALALYRGELEEESWGGRPRGG
jgi:hypothetical protein